MVSIRPVTGIYNRTINKVAQQVEQLRVEPGYIDKKLQITTKDSAISFGMKFICSTIKDAFRGLVSKIKNSKEVKFTAWNDTQKVLSRKNLTLEQQAPYRASMQVKAVNFSREVLPAADGKTEIVVENYTFKNGTKVALKINSLSSNMESATLLQKTVKKGNETVVTDYSVAPYDFRAVRETTTIKDGEKKLIQTKHFDSDGKLRRVRLVEPEKETMIERNPKLNAVCVTQRDANGKITEFAQQNGKYIDSGDFNSLNFYSELLAAGTSKI